MASPALVTPNAAASKPTPIRRKLPSPTTSILNANHPNAASIATATSLRRKFLLLSAAAVVGFTPVTPALAESDEEYVKETSDVINMVRTTIALDKNDPAVADAVSHLRDVSNSWVAKYRREKSLLGRASFRDMYSALNAVSGHYVSFGPTAPIPAKRKQRILEEMDTAEKALQRGR